MTQILGLTPHMRDALLVIQELILLDGASPSYAEIAHEMGMGSRARVVDVLDDLEKRGYISRGRRMARSIVVLHPIPMPEEPEIVGTFDDHPLMSARAEERAAIADVMGGV